MSAGAKKLFDVMNNVGSHAGAQVASELAYGIVTSVDPLIIKREGDTDRAPLTAGFLVLSKMCQKFEITTASHEHIVISNSGTTDTRLKTLLIWPGLQIGERVILLSFNSGQKFFVEKLERWTNEA